MNKPLNPSVRSSWTLCLACLVLALLSACVHTKGGGPSPAKQKEAAIYNVQLGLSYMQQGDLVRAKDKLDRALTQDSNSADVHSARALLFQRMGQSDKADAEFRQALHLKPDDPDIVNNYAVYLCSAGRTDEGVKRFEEAARNPLYTTPWAAYDNAGVCLRAAKRDDKARPYFVRALQLRPNFAEAAFQLADLQFQHGDLTGARSQIDSFMGSFETTPDLLLLGTRVARAQHDRVAEQRYARKLQLDFPGTDQARAAAELERNPG